MFEWIFLTCKMMGDNLQFHIFMGPTFGFIPQSTMHENISFASNFISWWGTPYIPEAQNIYSKRWWGPYTLVIYSSSSCKLF